MLTRESCLDKMLDKKRGRCFVSVMRKSTKDEEKARWE
jgi:hypothetical protein